MSFRAVARERLPLLEPLRVLASVAVVHHHMCSSFLLRVGFGLPLFLLMLFGLTSSGTAREPLADFARRKARFLLVPWVRWSLIYVALTVLPDLARGRAPFGRLELGMLFYGGHLSLWFLPFAAAAVVAARVLQRGVERLAVVPVILAATLAAALWTEVVSPVKSFGPPWLPARAWLRSTPAIFWGLALGQSLRLGEARARSAALAGIGAISTLAFLVSPMADDPDSIPRRYAVALPLVCLAFAWKPRVPAFVSTLADLCFGVYLVHSLVGKTLGYAFDVARWPAAGHTAAAWIGSALLVAALRRAGLSWHELAPGERGPRARDSDPPAALQPRSRLREAA
jgi:peptidoglycan/LPS O-acetylase OafA/YrhL